MLFLCTSIVLVLIAFGVYIWRVRAQARMRAEVRNILFEYVPLDDFDLEVGARRNNSVSLLHSSI